MNTLKLFLTALALVSLVACGSKSKKESDEPTKKKASTSEKDDDSSADDTADDSSSDDDGSASVDPASLKETIYFEYDSNALTADAKTSLDENFKWLKEDPKRELLIEGHTDESGTNEYNLALGDRRARAAKDYLVALGAGPKRVKIITYGEERPVSNEDAQNRRSVFLATKK